MGYKDAEAKRAYQKEYNSRPEVREARRISYRNWASKNREHVRDREAKRRLEKRALTLIATTRTRARKRGLAFDLDLHAEDFQRRIDAGFCELTGQPFDLSPGRRFNSPSFDRIVPSRGYVYDNVRVVLNIMNGALNEWGEEVLRDVMRRWLLP